MVILNTDDWRMLNMKLKEDISAQGRIKGMLSSIVSTLYDVESDFAVEFCKWLLKKSNYAKRHELHERFPSLPQNMQRGDIVWAEFGMNIGDELSDQYKDGHYAMIWAQQGFVFTVFPLASSEDKKFNDCAVNIGKVQHLPGDEDSYLKVDMIRSVSIRRIRKLNNVRAGKVSITDENILKRINDKILDKLVINFEKGIDKQE